jgi:mRNA interferase RelE/StbE
MASYKLFFKKPVAKDLRGLPTGDTRKTLSRIETLADDLRAAGCKRLSGQVFYTARRLPDYGAAGYLS